MRDRLYRWLHRTWYEGGGGYWLLLPFAALYWFVIRSRRFLYRHGVFKTVQLAVPVIVVGNLTAGGTGKTPLSGWLAGQLKANGYVPGIVSLGYGGARYDAPMAVSASSDPAVVGDEPVLLAKRAGTPVMVDTDRARGAAQLIAAGCNVIIADDGLQHLRLARDYEICVVDGSRGFGNRLLLPAGPLRDSLRQLAEVDQVVVNGSVPLQMNLAPGNSPLHFTLSGATAHRLDESSMRPLSEFAGSTVHAVAAIGNPARFFDLLRGHGLKVIEHALPDHAPLDAEQLDFADDFDILMTEKDAVKLSNEASARLWYVPVELQIDPAFAEPWLERIETAMNAVNSGKHNE
jgi:tetraacyldisaccharide 4'-kinase